MSRSEVEVLQNLAARRQEIDARGREIDMREKLLKASEQRIDERIAELKGIESNIQSLLQQRDQAQEAELLSLVKVYEGMKPADAARIFDKLDMDILLPVAQRMKPPKIAPVLAAMDADAAKRLTTNLARHLGGAKASETAPAAAPASSQGG
jgi:flagellar motility protein MotE (MotC chaperone)